MCDTLTRHHISRFVAASAAAVILIAALTGCDPNKINDELSERLEQDGYSFMPPDESGWFIGQRSAGQITLLKAGRVEGQSFLIEAGQLPLDKLSGTDELPSFTEETQIKTFPRPRFRIREHDISDLQISGANCAMSHVVAEDRDPGTGSNVVTAVLVDAVGTICIHPSRPNLGIAMNITHRSFPEDRDRGFEARGLTILRTQQFSDSKGQGDN